MESKLAYNDTSLSRQDTLNLIEICNRAIKITRINELKKLIPDLDYLFLFDYAYCFYADLKELIAFTKNPQIEYLDVNFPNGLLESYLELNMHIDDPVAKEYIKTFEVQNWKECFKKYQNQGLLPILKDNEIIDGYTHGVINTNLGTASSFSFANTFLDKGDRTKTILSILIPHLNEAYNRCLNPQKRNLLHLKTILTDRELETLKWLKLGKTSWEISVILNISERTVNFHINNIIKKLNATNRTHAVAIACSMGVLEM